MQAIGRSAPFVVLASAAVYFLMETRQLEFPRAPDRLGPDVWPQILLVLLIAACVIGIGRNLLADRGREPPAPSPQQPATVPGDGLLNEPEVPSRYGLVAAGFLLFLAYPFALEYLGFLLATFLLMVLFMLVGLWRNVLAVVAVSGIGTLGLFYIFRGLVYVSLPLGVGPFRSATLWVAALMGMR
jgi:putative tricarboxylic transport membrane protein